MLEFIEHYVESKFQVMFDELNVHIECAEIMNAIDQYANTVFRSGHFPRSWAMVRWVVGSILHGGPIELFLVPASAPRLV